MADNQRLLPEKVTSSNSSQALLNTKSTKTGSERMSCRKINEQRSYQTIKEDIATKAERLEQFNKERRKIEEEMRDVLTKIKANYQAQLKTIDKKRDKYKRKTTSDLIESTVYAIKSYLVHEPAGAFILVYNPDESDDPPCQDDDFILKPMHLACRHYAHSSKSKDWAVEDFVWTNIKYDDNLLLQTSHNWGDKVEALKPCLDQTYCREPVAKCSKYTNKSHIGNFVFIYRGEFFGGDSEVIVKIIQEHIDNDNDHQSWACEYKDFDQVNYGDQGDGCTVMIKVNVPFTKISLNFDRISDGMQDYP